VWFNILAIRQGRAEVRWKLVVIQLKQRFKLVSDLLYLIDNIEMEEEAREFVIEKLSQSYDDFTHNFEPLELIMANNQAEEIFQQFLQLLPEQQTLADSQVLLEQQTQEDSQTLLEQQTQEDSQAILEQQTQEDSQAILEQQTQEDSQTLLEQQTQEDSQTLLEQQGQEDSQIQQNEQAQELPELDEFQSFKKEWDSNAEQINIEGKLYDELAQKYNLSIQQPHGRFIARLFGLYELHYFNESVTK